MTESLSRVITLGRHTHLTVIPHTAVMKQSSANLGILDAQEFSAIVWAMIGEFALSSEATIGIARVSPQGGQGELADSREIPGGVVFTNSLRSRPRKITKLLITLNNICISRYNNSHPLIIPLRFSGSLWE